MAAERLRLSRRASRRNTSHSSGPVEALTEVMTGRIDFYFLPIAPALTLIRDGKLTCAGGEHRQARAPPCPNVPTTAEAGYHGRRLRVLGRAVPAREDARAPSCNKLHDETRKALDVASVQERLAKLGVQPMPMNIEQFDKFFRDDVAATIKLGKDIGITAED